MDQQVLFMVIMHQFYSMELDIIWYPFWKPNLPAGLTCLTAALQCHFIIHDHIPWWTDTIMHSIRILHLLTGILYYLHGYYIGDETGLLFYSDINSVLLNQCTMPFIRHMCVCKKLLSYWIYTAIYTM